MIIDLILDVKHSPKRHYFPDQFYRDVLRYCELTPVAACQICEALDYGEEEDVQQALCDYIDNNDYNPSIKDWIRGFRWLTPGVLQS